MSRQVTIPLSAPTPETAKVAESPDRGECGRACPPHRARCACRYRALNVWLAQQGYDKEIP
jgi:hypothetical protein